ncbi:MAG: hypothetical protein AAFR56_03340 [Chloroflexota bacterium]
MTSEQGSCPLTQQELIDEYFMEYRAVLLSVAAFLDRMDRSIDKNAEDDFRVKALRASLHELTSEESQRVERIQMILSDRDTTLMDERDSQSAYGAFNPESRKPAAAVEEA